MTETAVKNKICRHCGADVRPDTQFCYNCGGSLAPENGNGSKDGAQIVASQPTTKLVFDESADAPIAESANAQKTAIEDQTKLKSAASMRRKSKIVQPKQIEVIWEEHENAPNVWFILTALLLTAGAIAIYYVASYLK